MKPFIRKCNFYMLFWFFLVGSVAGFFIEGLWCVVKQGAWEHHGSTVWGPFCIIYGVGAVAVYALSCFLEGRNFVLQSVVYMFAGAAVEYFGSLFQEICFGSTSWNYTGQFMNLKGRVSLETTLIWGALGILFGHILFPLFRKLFYLLNGRIGYAVTWCFIVYMSINLLLTSAAVARWHTRTISHTAPRNGVEVLLDSRFNDDRMKRLFVNLQFVK